MNKQTRIALLADIHGNTLALEAVLQDIETRGGVDDYWFLGDYAAIGPDPVGVLSRITPLPNARFIRGNTDRYLFEEIQPYPSAEDVIANPDLFDRHTRVARSFAWTTGAVAATGWLPWLQQLPLDIRATLPDGTRVLLVHAAPGKDDLVGINPDTPDQEIAELIEGCEADLILVGHTHAPFDRTVNGIRIVNPGSLSNPKPPDWRASYVILSVGETGYEIEFVRVAYDREAVVRTAREGLQPSWEFIRALMFFDANS